MSTPVSSYAACTLETNNPATILCVAGAVHRGPTLVGPKEDVPWQIVNPKSQDARPCCWGASIQACSILNGSLGRNYSQLKRQIQPRSRHLHHRWARSQLNGLSAK